MCSIKLRPAFAAAAVVLAVVPPAASAAGAHAGPKLKAHRDAAAVRCHVSLFAEPHVIASGEPLEVFGQSLCPGGASAASQTVTLYARTPGSGFKVLSTLAAGPGGFYSLRLPAVTTDTVFYARTGSVRSPNRHVRVAPVVIFAGAAPFPGASPTSGATVLHTGPHNSVTFIGSVSPSDVGAHVTLQRESQSSFEEWVPIERGVVGSGSTFAIKHTFRVPGDANLRMVVRPHAGFSVRGFSEPISYSISQPQNPNLTLEGSPNPILSGQSVGLKGVLKNGAGQKVALFARTVKGPGPTKIDETTAAAGGAYTFTEKPLQSTIYRAVAGAVRSTGQFEGVKYVLTTNPPASKVQAGQSVTIAGTVSPVQVGHPVYLERQNALGHGFHVIEVTTVGAGGTYSLSRPLFGSGTAVVRVHVPGGPENQGNSSQTFNVEITPAPPGALRPVPPGKLPSEGKL